MLRCAQSARYNVLVKYACARRFFARLASEIFLSSLQTVLFTNLLACSEAENVNLGTRKNNFGLDYDAT
jgi:hypothetical protein